MQKSQALHCNSEVSGAKVYCRFIRRYTVMKKQQKLYCNAVASGAAM
jgi:hypothetical protein